MHTLKSPCPVCDIPVHNSDMNSHLDKCLSEPIANHDEDEGPSVSDPRRARVEVMTDEDEMSDGWRDFGDNNDEDGPDEPLPEKENVASSNKTPTGYRASKSGVDLGDDDVLAQPLPLESPLEGATRIKTRASAAATDALRYDDTNLTITNDVIFINIFLISPSPFIYSQTASQS